MEIEISCLPRAGRGTKSCFCLQYIFLQGMSHQFEVNVIIAFYNKFWNQFGKFFKHSWFFAFGIWKNEGFTFLICYYFSVINIYCFLDLLPFRWSWYMIIAPGIFLMICSSVCDFWKVVFMLFCSFLISHTKKIRKKHTHTTMFLFEKSWGKFFLNHLLLQFNSRINRGFFLQIVPIWRNY